MAAHRGPTAPSRATTAAVAVTVAREAVPGEALTWVGPNVATNLDSGIGRLVRQFGTVTAFRLDVALEGCTRPVRVPNHLAFDRRVGADVIHEFLMEAGFMQLPGPSQVLS